MASWNDVSRLALALPEANEEEQQGRARWMVRDKVFVWERPLRPSDLKALGSRAPKGAILAVRVEHLLAKEARLAAQPDVCFTTPHFNGYPAVLVRLGRIGVADLRELIVEAWLARAPKSLVRQYQSAARFST